MLKVVEALRHSVGVVDGSIVPNQQPTAWSLPLQAYPPEPLFDSLDPVFRGDPTS